MTIFHYLDRRRDQMGRSVLVLRRKTAHLINRSWNCREPGSELRTCQRVSSLGIGEHHTVPPTLYKSKKRKEVNSHEIRKALLDRSRALRRSRCEQRNAHQQGREYHERQCNAL